MKKRILVLSLLTLFVFGLKSQEEIDYRRSSLTMVLIEDADLGKNKDLVIKSYENNPFPDKYNKHKIKDKKFDPSTIELSDEDYQLSGFYVDTLKSMKDFLMAMKKPLNELRYLDADSSAAVLEPTEKELLRIYTDKYIQKKQLAKQLVSTWFNRQEDGSMDWSVLQERGKYSASAEKLDDAKSAASDVDFLMDWDLISNTYTIFNKMVFYPNEPYAASVREKAKEEAMIKLAGKPEAMIEKTMNGIDKVYEKTKEGYTVKCTSLLYQLDWDEKIAEKAKNYFFNDNIDPNLAWDTTSIFKMNFVGKLTTASLVTMKLGEKRTEEEIIDLQIKRTLDNAMAKLQKKYVQFRPVSPIETVEPLTAKIGLKEGVEPGQKYEILENEFDEFGIPNYKKIGYVKVDKKAPICDNRYGAGQEPKLDEEGNEIENPEFTTFKGGKKATPGLSYIRLVK